MKLEEQIQEFLNTMNEDDFRIISEILKWDNEKKSAFMLANKIFKADLYDED